MSIYMHYCYYSRLDLLHFLTETALLFSLALKWLLLLPADGIWLSSSSDESEDDEARACQRAAAAQAIRASLRVSTYGELEELAAADDGDAAAAAAASTTCAVCLSEVGRRSAVWELGNCRHVFHKGCLDRWLDHDDHLSCPLCRAPLLPRQPSAPPPPPAEPSWAVERLLYLFGDNDVSVPLGAPA